MISIITVNYNNSKLTISCVLRTLKTLSLVGVPFEIVIVDNASTDRSYSQLNKAFKELNNVKVVLAPKNSGFGYGNNYGARQSKFDILWFLNSDAWVDKISEIKEACVMACSSTSGLLGTLVIEENGDRYPIGGGEMTFPYLVGSNLRIGKVIRKARFFLKALQLIPEKVLPNVIKRYTNSFNIYDLKGYVPVSFISGASFLVNKQKYIAAGGFDEGFFLYDEDMDLSQRFKNNGLHNYIICNVLVKTINSSTTRKLKSIELKKIKRRSRKHLIIKHFKGIRKLVLLWMNEITWPLL